MHKEMIPFDQLVPGWEADPPLNVRLTDHGADLDELASSLKAVGQLYPFIVQYHSGVPYVVDGGRRVLAWRTIMKADDLDTASPMECVVLEDYEDAREVSLAASETPLPPHVADVVSMFASLQRDGKTPEEIAKRFGYTDLAVRRLLALGVLSPKVLAAWRAGKIDVEAARAYTLASDHVRQDKLLKKYGNSAWQVKRELGADNNNAGYLLEFAGADYEAAGGTVTRDLFGEDHVVDDMPLLERLAGEKIKAKADALVADGWGWACQRDELPDTVRWMTYAAPDAKGAKTPKERRGDLGCLLAIDRGGKLVVEYGMEKPKARKAGAATRTKAGGGAAEPAPDISNALMQRLSEAATLAMQDLFREHHRVAIAALIAGANVQGSGSAYAASPLALTIRGYKPGVDTEEEREVEFAEAFQSAMMATDLQLHQMVAVIAARCLDMRVYNANREPFRHGSNEDLNEAATLALALPDNVRDEAMLKRFDAADYFKSASKKVVLRAIERRLGAEQARTAAKLKSAQLAEFALANLPGWLPPELIPGDEPKAAPDPKKEPAAPKGRKRTSGKPAKKATKRSR